MAIAVGTGEVTGGPVAVAKADQTDRADFAVTMIVTLGEAIGRHTETMGRGEGVEAMGSGGGLEAMGREGDLEAMGREGGLEAMDTGGGMTVERAHRGRGIRVEDFVVGRGEVGSKGKDRETGWRRGGKEMGIGAADLGQVSSKRNVANGYGSSSIKLWLFIAYCFVIIC